MTKTLIRIVSGIVILQAVLGLWLSEANAWELISLRDLSINYRHYGLVNPNGRDSLLYPEPPKEGVDVLINTSLLDVFYWDSEIESLTTDGQYRSIGLETRLGVNLTSYWTLGFYHHSQHLLDRHHSFMDKFPVADALETRIYLYRGREQGSLW